MADLSYRIKRFAAPGGVWTQILTPIDCNTWSVHAATGQTLETRSDVNDATTEDTTPAGSQESLTVGRPEGEKGYRYRAGDAVCAVMPASPDTVIGKFVR